MWNTCNVQNRKPKEIQIQHDKQLILISRLQLRSEREGEKPQKYKKRKAKVKVKNLLTKKKEGKESIDICLNIYMENREQIQI